MILYALGGSGFVMVAAVLGFFLLVGSGGDDGAAPGPAALREAGCTYRMVPAAPNLKFKGDSLRHVAAAPRGFRYNTDPPTSGIHTSQTVIYGIYDQPVPPISTVHNMEHGGIVIRYGPAVPAETVAEIGEFYTDDPNGLVVAPMRGLGDTIALTAWTLDQGRIEEEGYEGEGHLAKCKRFDQDAFEAFVDEYRGKGPERFDVGDLLPGRG
jgi:Protein of unknown function (DUF3105)